MRFSAVWIDVECTAVVDALGDPFINVFLLIVNDAMRCAEGVAPYKVSGYLVDIPI